MRKINESLQVSAPPIPNSVAVRGTSDSDERLCDTIKCFDLGNLVRDCHYPVINMPSASQHGLDLQSYQKTSLQWLIDKETNPSGMGTAGKLWFLMRGRNGSGNQMFFYCELTKSIVMNIFNYSSDIDQGDVTTCLSSVHCTICRSVNYTSYC